VEIYARSGEIVPCDPVNLSGLYDPIPAQVQERERGLREAISFRSCAKCLRIELSRCQMIITCRHGRYSLFAVLATGAICSTDVADKNQIGEGCLAIEMVRIITFAFGDQEMRRSCATYHCAVDPLSSADVSDAGNGPVRVAFGGCRKRRFRELTPHPAAGLSEEARVYVRHARPRFVEGARQACV
jgi:hypothetical protein